MLLHNRIDLRPSFAFAPRWCSSFKYNRSRPKKFYCIRHVFATRWRSSFVSSLETKKFYCILEESCRNCVVSSKFPSSHRHIVVAISSCRESTRVSSTISQFVSANSTCIKLLDRLSRESRPRVSNCIILESCIIIDGSLDNFNVLVIILRSWKIFKKWNTRVSSKLGVGSNLYTLFERINPIVSIGKVSEIKVNDKLHLFVPSERDSPIIRLNKAVRRGGGGREMRED